MTAEEKKKVAVDFLRLAGQGHPREMQGVLKAGGIHHNVYVQRGWDALLTAMEEAGKNSAAAQARTSGSGWLPRPASRTPRMFTAGRARRKARTTSLLKSSSAAKRIIARPDARGEPHFDLGLRLSTGPGALRQVSVDAVAVAQRVRNEGVRGSEIDRRIALAGRSPRPVFMQTASGSQPAQSSSRRVWSAPRERGHGGRR